MSNPTTITAPAGEAAIEIARVVDAPLADVWRAYTEADLVAQWLGPRGYEMDIVRYDVRDGGGYQYIHRNEAGDEFGFRGVFHSVVPENSIVQTFEYNGAPGHVSLETVRFEDLGGKTRIHGRSIYLAVADRDAMIDSGMERGVVEGFERLDDVLASVS